MRLARQGEFHVEAEVLSDGGVGRRGEQRVVALEIVVERESDVAAHGVVGSEGGFDGAVAAGGLGERRLDVARDSVLIAEREVEAQVEVVGERVAVAIG